MLKDKINNDEKHQKLMKYSLRILLAFFNNILTSKKSKLDALFIESVDNQINSSKLFIEALSRNDVEKMIFHNNNIHKYSKEVKKNYDLMYN